MKAAGLSASVLPDMAAVPTMPVADIFAEITAGLSNGSELESLLGRFLAPIVQLAGAQAGLVRTLSDDGEHMRLVGDIGLPPEVRLSELSVDRHCGTCGIAVDRDAMTWSVDLKSCARHSNDAGYFGRNCRRMLAVPLRHRGQLLGIYNLFFDTHAELGADILAVLRSIGELLGLALHNARLERANLCATVMSERKFLASEVHDSIAQSLVYVNMRLPLLRDAMLAHDDQRSLRYFSDVKRAVGEIHGSLREILENFRIGMDPQGLWHALQQMVEEFGERTGMALEFDCEANDLGLSAEQEVQVFHIVQEALANVSRHAQASQAWLHVGHHDGRFEVRVEDNGQGVAGADQPGGGHFGLAIMRERAERLGGTIEVGPREQGGTRVVLSLPSQPPTEGRTA
ncbi:MAG: ATP-binding protein [Hylemonella sp.]|nr:ATP-binding protein [Hylemonella sp.]